MRHSQTTNGLAVTPKETALPLAEGAEWRQVHQFSATETAAIVSGCKSRGISIASFIQAAILHAMSAVGSLSGEALDNVQRSLVPEQLHEKLSGTTAMPISIELKPRQEVYETCKVVRQAFQAAREFQLRDVDAYISALLKMFPSTT